MRFCKKIVYINNLAFSIELVFFIYAFTIVSICYLDYYRRNSYYFILKYNKYNTTINEIKKECPYKDRDLQITKRIEFKTTRNIKLGFNSNRYIIIAILSSPHNFRKRYSFRYNYKKYNLHNRSRMVFFIASSKYEDEKLLNTESNLYNDVVQFSFQNSYLNLTLLSIMALKYCSRVFKRMKFYIKTDDDMFVNYNLLYNLINNLDPNARNIYGHLGGMFKVNRNKNHYSYIPYFQLSHEYMPKYVYGGLIIITKEAIIRIYNQTLVEQQYIWREDINIGMLSNLSGSSILQFPYNIDIKLNGKNCIVSNRIVALEIKSSVD